MTEYEVESMNTCLENVEHMRQLGLPINNVPFAGFVKDAHNSNGHPSVDNLEPEKDDSLEEFDAMISRVLDKNAKKATVQRQNQGAILTRSNAKKTTIVEAVAAQENDCQDGPTEDGMDSADDLFDEGGPFRGPNIGKKLDRMTRSRKGPLPLVIEPGRIRPSSVTIAAKFVIECNIAVRGHMPIFPHWKEYKKRSFRPVIKAYIKRVCSKFETERNSIHVQRACVAMLKKAVRQQRYKLKLKYFVGLQIIAPHCSNCSLECVMRFSAL